MAAGAFLGVADRGGGAPPRGDQRALGRKVFAGGGPISRDPEEVAWLKYLADIARTGEGTPRARGFRSVERR